MEGAPDVDTAEMRDELLGAVPGLVDIHHIHIWSLTPERPLLTLHARIADDAQHDEVLHRLQHVLVHRYSIKHSTIQIERNYCRDEISAHNDCEPIQHRHAGSHG
jgi:cobalt-zinc-cadmium efflux system protein